MSTESSIATDLTYTVSRNTYGEWVVRYRQCGVSMPEWTYYGSDKHDAYATAYGEWYRTTHGVFPSF